MNAFASGGFLPAKVRGSKYEGLVHAADWYGTFCELAGVDPTDWRAAAAGLPPVDSHSMVPVLLGTGSTSTRVEIPIGTEPRLVMLGGKPDQVSTVQGLIQEADQGSKLWKLLIGFVEQSGHTGPHYPNATTDTCCFDAVLQSSNHKPRPGCPTDDPCPRRGVTNCTEGCLYELRSDPSEYHELSAQHPDIVAALLQRIVQVRESAFLPVRCQCDDGFGGIACAAGGCADARACEMVQKRWGGFWGPFVDVPGESATLGWKSDDSDGCARCSAQHAGISSVIA